MKHLKENESIHTTLMHKEEKVIPAINLLFTDYGISSKQFVVKSNIHNFWQMEFILDGAVLVCFDKSQRVLSEGEILIIPPGVKHHFAYNSPRKTWSFKFNQTPDFIKNPKVILLSDKNRASKKLSNIFFLLLADYRHIPNIDYPTLEYLIGGLMAINYITLDKYKNIPEWVIIAKEFITINIENNINLEDLAEHLNYTRIHLSRLCKKHLNMKLKDFFDLEVMDIAKKKLLYSNKTITTIAKETGFNDIYTFSRFYKRVTSLTPSQQRNLLPII